MSRNIHPELIAPCGMNCAICGAYLAWLNKTPKKKGIIYCEGCRPRNRQCALIKKKCRNSRRMIKGKIEFCYDCDFFPCEKLVHLDTRYRKNYSMSMIENLNEIRDEGLVEFIENQYEKYRCSKCEGLKSVHNGKCYHCDKIKSWKD